MVTTRQAATRLTDGLPTRLPTRQAPAAAASAPDKVLHRLWTQAGASFAAYGGKHLLREAVARRARRQRTTAAPISDADVDRYLAGQQAYTRHAPRRKRFLKPFYDMSKLFHLMEVDLFHTHRVGKHNLFGRDKKECKFLMLAIECTSRKIAVRPMEDKRGATAARVFRQILTEDYSNRLPHTVRSDRGSEWKSPEFRQLLKELNIRQLFASNTEKAGMAERAGQTTQGRIWRYLTHHNTLTFIPVLQKIVKSINATPHSATGVAPDAFRQEHVYPSWESYYLKHMQTAQRHRKRSFALQPGDRVRLALLDESGLSKAYRGTYTPETFIVKTRRYSNPVSYVLEDENGTAVDGNFYEPELIRVTDVQGPKQDGRRRGAARSSLDPHGV